jgi:hypothetical protein
VEQRPGESRLGFTVAAVSVRNQWQRRRLGLHGEAGMLDCCYDCGFCEIGIEDRKEIAGMD